MTYTVKLDSNGKITTPNSLNVAIENVIKNVNGVATKQNGNTVFDPTMLKNVYINKPTILDPINGSTTQNTSVTGSAYSTNNIYSGLHSGSVIEVATDQLFTNIVYTHTNTYPGQLPMYIGTPGTTYFMRIKYISNEVESEWSNTINYVQHIVGIIPPSITIDASTLPNIANISTYSIRNATDSHISTDWEIATDINFTNIVNTSLNDTVNLTSYSIPTNLNSNSKYYIRARYHSASYTSMYVYNELTVIIKLPTVLVTMGANSLVENSSTIGTIDNYINTAIYTITALKGTIVYNNTSTFTYTSQAIPGYSDETDTITINSSKAGMYDSDATSISLNIINIPYTLDQTLNNANYGLNLDVTSGYII